MTSGPRRRGALSSGVWGDFGSAVTERRLELGLTQRDMAALADVSLTTVQALEAGRRATRVDSLHRILRALGWALVALPLAETRRTAGAVLLPVDEAGAPR